ncbi:hypothetical protein AGMMS50268_32440 [Spirochaetia bacterium]|nr:hypothetical protein AGMMS50268_32440 [Spirochaetia bacterium]
MKKPRFFCDNCGAEVKQNTKSCPQCGRFFASVRCPKCGFTGSEDLFRSGCPACGYSASEALPENSPEGRGTRPKADRREAVGALPIWVYILTGLVMIGVFAIMFRVLR